MGKGESGKGGGEEKGGGFLENAILNSDRLAQRLEAEAQMNI